MTPLLLYITSISISAVVHTANYESYKDQWVKIQRGWMDLSLTMSFSFFYFFGHFTVRLAFHNISSGLDFHIWNANSPSFGRAKTDAKMAAHGEKFCTSVSVLFAILYVSSSPLNDFSYLFLFGSATKRSQP